MSTNAYRDLRTSWRISNLAAKRRPGVLEIDEGRFLFDTPRGLVARAFPLEHGRRAAHSVLGA